MTNTDESDENRRTFLRAAGGVAAGLLAIPGAARAGAHGNNGGGATGEAPVIEELSVAAVDGHVEASYKVTDADGDLDYVALGVIDRNRTVGFDYADISGGEAEGTLQTDALEPGKYRWVFGVVDEAKQTDEEKGKVTV